jgi:hypothetical protein
MKLSLHGGDSSSTGVVAGAMTAAKRQKRAVKSKAYKVLNNCLSPHQALRSHGGIGEGAGDRAAGSPVQVAVLSQEDNGGEDASYTDDPDDAANNAIDNEEVEDDGSVGGGSALAWADTAPYNEDINVEEGGSGLRHGMAKLEAVMSVPGSTAAWFAEQARSTTMAKMATTYKAVVHSIVDDQAGALAAALAFEANKRTYLAVPNGEGDFSVFHGLTWWAEAPGGARNQQGHLVAFEGNVRSGRGVPNLWRFDEPDEQLFWLVKLPLVSLCNVAMFYASDNNNNYYRDMVVPDKGGVGWALRCRHLNPIPGE